MANEKKLLLRLEAENAQLLKKADQAEKKIKSLEQSAGKSLHALKRDFDLAATGANKLGKAANDSGRRMGAVGYRVSNFSSQIQDMAVQFEMGANRARVLAQQLPQMGMSFGVLGTVIGTVVGVGIAAYSMFKDLRSESEKLADAIESIEKRASLTSDGLLNLTDRVRELAKVSKEAARVELAIAINQSNIAINQATKQITASIKEIAGSAIAYQDALDNFDAQQARRSELAKQAGLSESEIASIAKTTESAYIASQKKIRESLGLSEEQMRAFAEVSRKALAEPTLENFAAFYELAKALDLSNEKLEGFFDTLGTNAAKINQHTTLLGKLNEGYENIEETLDRQEKKKKVTGGKAGPSFTIDPFGANEKSAVESMEDSMRSQEQVLEDSYIRRQGIIEAALLKSQISIDKANELSNKNHAQYIQAMNALDEQRIQSLKSFYSQSLGIIADGLGESNVLAKAAFAAQQAIAISDMIVNTERAAVAALAAGGPYAGPALAAITKGLGYAAIGVVAGQTIASFDGGGFTGSGPRSGGMDGKGGKLAMLHPNETVIDHTKGQGAGYSVEVYNYGNDQATAQVDDTNRIVKVIIGEMGNPASRSRAALHQTSNVTPRGSR